MNERTYGVAETAVRIGIAVRTVREWIRIGHLQAYKIPGEPWWRIPESEIKRLAGTKRYNRVKKEASL